MASMGRGGARACVGYVRVHALKLCVQRERDASGKRAAPAHGAHARVVGAGGETTHRNAELQDRLQAPACHGADGETITRDAMLKN